MKAVYITSVLFFCAYPLPNSLKLHDDVLIFLSRHGSLQSNLTVLLNEAVMNLLNNEELIMNGWLAWCVPCNGNAEQKLDYSEE